MYEFLRHEFPEIERVAEKKLQKIDLEAVDIFTNIEEDKLCAKTFEEFAKIYGSIAGNLALTTLCYGGIYLVGVGILINYINF